MISHLNQRRQIVSLLHYSTNSLNFLLTTIETDNDLSQLAFESLLANERGFTLNKLGYQGRLILFQIASKSYELSRLIFTRWISQGEHELIDILHLCQISSLNQNKTTNKYYIAVETALRYFLDDQNIRQIVINNIKITIGINKLV